MTSVPSTELLTKVEQEVYDRLPQPPATTQVTVTNIWIIEWLPTGDRRTGLELWRWLNERRPGWAHYVSCQSRRDVFDATALAVKRASETRMRPVLHLEAHGNEEGLWGPGTGLDGFIRWEDLHEPL